jgi:hypothetical protein
VILTTFALSALCVALLLGTPLDNPASVIPGVVCGLIVWLFIAIFHWKTETVTLLFQDRSWFTTTITAELKELGFDAQPRADGHLVFRPSFHSLLVGQVRVQVSGDTAKVIGPKLSLERLRKRLRIACHLEKVHKAGEGRARLGENLLRRVLISLRVSGTQWRWIAHEVTQVLANEGAEVLCDVNILAHSDDGIREGAVDRLILDRLRRRQIPVEVHKEQVHAARAARA